MTRSMRMSASLLVLILAACGSSSPTETSTSRMPAENAYPVAQAFFTGPITGGQRGHAMWDSWYDMAELGYVEEEYFASGRAKVQPGGAEADYTTRIILWRPQRAEDFNGTVFLDWVNVSAQFENSVETLAAHAFLVRHGYAFVHVSAQAAGLCCTPLTPKAWDPQRYAALNHPGDEWSFDLFAQIAGALRAPRGVDPMGGLRVERVLAGGHSQSGIRLHDYVNKGYARSRAADAILVHGDIAAGKNFTELPVPVLQLHSDWEAAPAEPAIHDNYVLWEVAGTSHADFWVGVHQTSGQGPRAIQDAPKRPASADDDLHATAANYGEQPDPALNECTVAGNAFPSRYAVNAALHYLNRWVIDGSRPPAGPRYEFAAGALARDANGNALGGIRYPPIVVPVASYQSTTCQLGGITVPFPDAQLQLLYPTHADYFCRMQAATRESVAAGFLLPEDAEELMARVEGAAKRWTMAGQRDCP